VKSRACPKAAEGAAAENAVSNEAKIIALMSCLIFNMRGFELTTFDSSDGINAARDGTKEMPPASQPASNVIL